jgi:hypothetical protein
MAPAQPQLSLRALFTWMVIAAAALAGCADRGEEGPATPPDGSQARVPAAVERAVHDTFHRLPRSCGSRRADDRVLDGTTSRFIRWYRRYPADRYDMRIDDEAGTMLSAILVLRYELARCSPRHAARVDAVLPRKIRRGLTPRREAGARGRR